MKKFLIFLTLILLTFFIGTVFAENQVIDSYYNSNNSTLEFHLIDFSSFLFRVHTEVSSTCKYSMTSGVKFSDMSLNFDYDYGLTHEKTFASLEDGIYKYYIKCNNSNNTLEPIENEIDLRVDSLVTGDIVLTPESPLRSGKVKITLITSKPVFKTPILTYSYDGVVNTKVSLIGSEKTWIGYMIIPPDVGNVVGSFKLSVSDLEGRIGEQINSGGVFIADTVKPKSISFVGATGDVGQIKLSWYSEENLNKFNIYRSTSPNVDYTNFYKSVEKSPFLDNMVEKGKTYYYRVSVVDESENEGDLSNEISATALIDNSSYQSSGLDLSLRGLVENFIIDIDSLFSDISSLSNSISLKSEKEKNLFSGLGLGKIGEDAKLELNSLKNDVIKYKQQDLTKEELLSKLNSAKLKLDLIRKKVPEDIIITSEDSRIEALSKETLEVGLLEINSSISDKDKERDLKNSLDIIKSSLQSIKSSFYNCDVVYLDGSKKQISIIERVISSELEKSEDTYFYEIIPKEAAESASLVKVLNSDYKIIKDDPILAFGADNKKIFYSLDKSVSLGTLRDIKILLINSASVNESFGISGYFVFSDLSNNNYTWIIFGAIILFVLLFYFIYFKKNSFSPDFVSLDKEVDEGFNLLKLGKLKEAEEKYDSLNKTYIILNKKEKSKAFPILESFRNKILIFKITEGIDSLGSEKDFNKFEAIKKYYNELLPNYKKTISKSFEKLKKDFENE